MKNKLLFCILSSIVFTANVSTSQSANIENYSNFGIIISGPSGVGKTTLIEAMAKKHNDFIISVSATTRQKRIGETEGKSYFFLTRQQFTQLVKKDEFIEYAENYGNFYGSPKRNYIEAINGGKNPVFALSASGMKNATKNKKMDFVTIFIAPASNEELYKRLSGRGTENETQIKCRFESAKD